MTPTNHDVRVAALLDQLSAIEHRLDPAAHRRGQRIADLATVAVAVPTVYLLNLPIDRPLMLFGFMVAGLVLNRIPSWMARRKLVRAQDRLFKEYSEIVGLAESEARQGSVAGVQRTRRGARDA